jgi:DNA-binding XRE family transcriptional regulator
MDWSRGDLSKASKISQETIKNIEHGIFRPQEVTENALIRAFSMNGVEFTEDDGVRKSQSKVFTYEGSDGLKKFLDDVFETTRQLCTCGKTDKISCISHVDDKFFLKHLGDYAQVHVERMNKIEACKTRILIEDKPYSYTDEERRTSSYREYKQHPYETRGNVPFYVYGDKLAILIFDESKPPKIVVIPSKLVASAYREQFDLMWKTALPLGNL